jgi:hypothetical protein
MKPRPVVGAALAALLATTACFQALRSLEETSQPPANLLMAELWQDPGEGRANLFDGPGGGDGVPAADEPFEFVERDTSGASPGYDVRDRAGRLWSVKLGIEVQPEVVVSRVLWATGFHQHPSHYRARWTLTGGDTPGPQPPGRFRLKPEGHRKAGNWSFYENPFRGTQPYKGLLLVLLVLNSWDLADNNNTLYEVDPPEHGVARWYVVKDVGAALGGNRSAPLRWFRSPFKGDLAGFEETGFLKGFDGERARLEYRGRFYAKLYRQHDVADVRWACDRLGRLSAAQWDDAFRAAGYEGEEKRRYIRKIREKLDQAEKLLAAAK